MSVRALLLALLLLAAPRTAALADERERDEREDAGEEKSALAARQSERVFESSRAVEVVRPWGIPATTGEALLGAVGVWSYPALAAGGTPTLRGLGGRRVLLLADGVRLQTGITPLEGGDLLGWVDPLAVRRVEVLRGAGGAAYGGGAEGGVISLLPRRYEFDPGRAWDAAGELRAGFASASLAGLGNLTTTGHLRAFGLQAGGSFRRLGDVQGGHGVGREQFTGHQSGDAAVEAIWAPSTSSSLRASYALLRQPDLGRPDRSTPEDFLITQRARDAVALRYQSRQEHFIRAVDASLSFQRLLEVRDRFRVGRDLIERERDLASSLGLALSLASELPRNRLGYGLDLVHDWIGSAASLQAVSVGERERQARGRYPDGSRYLETGLYVLDHLSLTSRLSLDLGARLATWSVSAPAVAGPDAQPEIASTWVTGLGSLHASYLLGDGLNLVAGLSQGYLAPNVDDLTAVGCGDRGYRVPAGHLDPEKSLTAEAGVKLDLFGVLTASAAYTFTALFDPIVEVPVALTLPWSPSASCGGPALLPTTTRANAASARVHGVEVAFRLAIRAFELYSWLAWSHGEQELQGAGAEPLSRVPPLGGVAGLRYKHEKRQLSAELSLRWAGPQRRLSSADLRDPRICPAGAIGCEGTDGYAVLRLQGGLELVKPVRLLLAIDNLTNASYRVHGAGFPAPGISAIAAAQVEVP